MLVSPAKMVELIEMSFGMFTRVCQMNHAWIQIHIGIGTFLGDMCMGCTRSSAPGSRWELGQKMPCPQPFPFSFQL